MFEDIDDNKEPRSAPQTLSIDRASSDRLLVYAIWTRNEAVGLGPEQSWAVLAERYPEDARFLLFRAYEELASGKSSAWTPTTFLAEVRKVLDGSGGRLNPEVRDLVALAEDELHPLGEEDAARLDRIRARVGLRSGDPDAARKRLQRFASDVVRELHDRTSGGKPIGRTIASIPASAAPSEWKTQLAAAKGARTTYAATAKVAAGDVVEHPKFGAGVVIGVEPGRANILFESGARKLLAG
ncbi:MAG: hypothetical protein JWP97_1747 [Labilithrix sp.]|nr:hypothetical protein [Labilithrix sp.]